MSRTLTPQGKHLLGQLRGLSEIDQRNIALSLIDPMPEPPIDAKWERTLISEADRRMMRLDSGEDQWVDGDDFTNWLQDRPA